MNFLTIRHSSVVVFCVVLLVAGGCFKELSREDGKVQGTGNIAIAFSHLVKDVPLDFTSQYTNAWNENYSVTTFKYYVHDFALVTNEGRTIPISSDYFLVDESKPDTKLISLKSPSGEYSQLTFKLGVDSALNVSGAQSGVLDPVNGMFWTWSSGYVMAKLEGISAAAVTSPNGNFTYHVGGFKQPTAVSKQITLQIPLDKRLTVSRDADVTVDVKVDIDTWFSRVNPIRIAEHPACHSPGDLAKQIADNYEGMFSITKIE